MTFLGHDNDRTHSDKTRGEEVTTADAVTSAAAVTDAVDANGRLPFPPSVTESVASFNSEPRPAVEPPVPP